MNVSRRIACARLIDYFPVVARRDPGEFLEGFSALWRRVRVVAAQAYAAFEVGSTQAKFLRHIARHSRISQADLARATETDPALTGRALETLIERGWVRRTRSEEDRRQYILELTAAGHRAHKRVEEARRQIAERMFSALDDRDIEDFDRITRKILAALEAPVEPATKPRG
jgi:DNA-binding MarR family transcriptional regulator